jgi:hypothetical protein
MQPSIPVPTDNIYKFICLFGLAVLVGSMLGSVYYISNSNELFMKRDLELTALNAKENLSPVEIKQKAHLEQHVEAIQLDRKISTRLFVACMLVSFFVAAGGFLGWFIKVQPKQDELINLQIEKMRYEIQGLEKQLREKKE